MTQIHNTSKVAVKVTQEQKDCNVVQDYLTRLFAEWHYTVQVKGYLHPNDTQTYNINIFVGYILTQGDLKRLQDNHINFAYIDSDANENKNNITQIRVCGWFKKSDIQ
jgi:hypothetical protein